MTHDPTATVAAESTTTASQADVQNTATATGTRSLEALGEQCIVMRGIGWDGYSKVLRVRGDRPVPQMVYLDGDLYLMSPSFPHERLRTRLGQLVFVVVEELDIPCIPSASTTFRRRNKDAGVEGDQSFYLANEARVRGKSALRLRVDPPPDLAIEAVHTNDPSAAIEVHRRFRVPEVWVCDGDEMRILVLPPGRRKYVESETSAAFPYLKASEILDWVQRPQTGSETEWIKDVRRWVRDVLVPRVRAPKS